MRFTETKIRQMIREELQDVVPEIHPTSQIFCDMDGVLVDFQSAVIKLTNSLLDGGGLPGVEKTKGFSKRLRAVQDELGPDWRARTGADLDIKPVRNLMFSAIGSNPGPVFADMQPLTDGTNQLWPFLSASKHSVKLLSAPVRARNDAIMTAGDGKRQWAMEWLKPAPTDIIIAPATQKPQYAISNGIPNILIDDKASTIKAWNDATEIAGLGRGYGILHITGNSAQTIEQLKVLGI